MISPIKFGVIGLGHIGKRHLKIATEHPHFDVSHVCDLLSLSNLGIDNCDALYSNNYHDVINSDIDALSICTPNHLHTPMAVEALKAGKHVIVEKPLALSLEDARELKALALEKKLELFCVLQNRYSPIVQWLKSVLDQDLLGDIYWAQVNCFWNRDARYYTKNGSPHPWHGSLEKDGGPLYTQFSHFIDILVWLFGDINVHYSKFYNFNHTHLTEFEDSGSITFDFINGGSGILNYSTSIWDQNQESSINLIGSKGTVKVGGQYMNKLEYCHIKGYDPPKLGIQDNINDYGSYKGTANNHFHIFENVKKVLLDKVAPDFDIDDSITGVGIIERIYSNRKL